MGFAAAVLYWVIVAVWSSVLVCALYFSRGNKIVFGSARILLAVVAVDTVRDIIENVYFGAYFGSQYGLFDKAVGTVLGQPILLMVPKIVNFGAACVVLFILLLNWFPKAVREREDMGQLASVDGLTGLLNRRTFLEAGEAEFQRSLRYNRPLAMLMIDIDHFKQVNDNYGHDIGDKVIAELGKVHARIARSTDITGRLGGEEFAILLTETGMEDASRFAERLRNAAASIRIPLPGETLQVTISVGISVRAEETLLADLIKHADLALYDAKHAGRNRIGKFVKNDDETSLISEPRIDRRVTI